MSLQGLLAKCQKVVQLWGEKKYADAFDFLQNACREITGEITPTNLAQAEQILVEVVRATEVPDKIASTFRSLARMSHGKRKDWLERIVALFQAEAEKRALSHR